MCKPNTGLGYKTIHKLLKLQNLQSFLNSHVNYQNSLLYFEINQYE
ncbi:hypothetical protein C723_0056 [Christiangramia flava JLT2011]|uniref:Uncharacterized protein n=1 Tax=Christiangramia flava JLT2011 TaxID=1229726 RepID=A0A1L7I4P3_9FLAO|nr:hypothetical protein GRFL_1842 [Christiangramia flava JLT2011]OSS40647.1 hypothetical protein C723_0056 [Christiangramia flava JLT2011]